jgi:preprotein translocase SecE subunit
VARQTRDERRKRRAEADGSAPARRREVARPVAETTPVAAAPRRPRGGFLGESYAELRKVEWPKQHQVIAGTVVVLVACILVGFYLWGADQVFRRLVQDVLLR